MHARVGETGGTNMHLPAVKMKRCSCDFQRVNIVHLQHATVLWDSARLPHALQRI